MNLIWHKIKIFIEAIPALTGNLILLYIQIRITVVLFLSVNSIISFFLFLLYFSIDVLPVFYKHCLDKNRKAIFFITLLLIIIYTVLYLYFEEFSLLLFFSISAALLSLFSEKKEFNNSILKDKKNPV